MFLLLLLSFYIRYLLFDYERANTVALQHELHLGDVLMKEDIKYFKNYYDYTLPHEFKESTKLTTYYNIIYVPSYSRFGPFCVGALLYNAFRKSLK